MICADTSTWINFLSAVPSATTEPLANSLRDSSAIVSPPVLTELMSLGGVKASGESQVILQLPRLALSEDFWQRAGEMRRQLLRKSLKARAMDCLIAQSCIDADVLLLTDDSDFRHFATFGLRLL
jgi:predicted nucleic acid-binding protein